MPTARRLAHILIGFALTFGAISSQAAEPLTPRQKTVLQGLARDRYTGRWAELNTNQLAVMHRRAEAYLRDLRRYHLVDGLVVSARFSDTNRSSVIRYEATEDSAAWTGFSLAAHTFRYVVTGDAGAFEDIRKSVAGIDRLLNVSGKPGYLTRFSAPADDPAYRSVYAEWGGADTNQPGMGRLAFTGGADHPRDIWLGGPSRDHYAAVNFGLMTVYQLVRDQTIRSQVSNSMTLLLDRLDRDGWRIDDGRGHRTFVTPLLQTALLRSGTTLNPGRFRRLYESKVAEYLKLPPPAVLQYGDYAPNVFNMASLNTLARLETGSDRLKLLFQERLSEMMRHSESHLNPFLTGCYLGGFFERMPISSASVVTMQGVLFEFPDPPRWATPVDQQTNAGLAILEANGRRWSKYTLQLPERPPAAFQWAVSPYLLSGGDGELIAHPGVDYLAAFWMGRDTTIIPSENYVAPTTDFRRPAAAKTNVTPAAPSPPRPR